MANRDDLIKRAFAEVEEGEERQFVAEVKDTINAIAEQQGIIAKAQETITELQAKLAGKEHTPTVREDIAP